MIPTFSIQKILNSSSAVCLQKFVTMNSSFKSDALSDELRKQGNQLYKQNKFIEALELYNKALCYAEKTSNSSFAYANRSAVYFALKLPKQCIENIGLARSTDYPLEDDKKLQERNEQCLKMMIEEEEEDPRDFFKLSYPAHETSVPRRLHGAQGK